MEKYKGIAAKDLLNTIEKEVAAGKLSKEVEVDRNTTVKFGNKNYYCRELIEQYKDSESNLAYRSVQWFEQGTDYHELYVDIFENGFLTTL